MPATRSRTDNWRQSLQGIYEKGGAIEISLPRYVEGASAPGEEERSDLVWRVRILSLSDAEIVVEQPTALGHPIRLQDGIELVGLMAIGQNRWMFRTRNLGAATASLAGGREMRAYRLRMPECVERCQRRNFYRISTVGLNLPRVSVSPLLDPASALLAEAACRCRVLDLQEHPISGRRVEAEEPVQPETGPESEGLLVNIGGGGIGLLFEGEEKPALDASDLLWVRVSLAPHIPAPLCMCARVRHTHLDSSQRLYAGLAFEFGHSQAHEKFVVDQLLRFVAQQQRDQLRRQAV